MLTSLCLQFLLTLSSITAIPQRHSLLLSQKMSNSTSMNPQSVHHIILFWGIQSSLLTTTRDRGRG